MSTHPSAALVRPFHKILIANRGEIACRVIRTARNLGYRTVAVFSQADALAPHVRLADEAVCLGPPAAAQSYLNIEAILSAARLTEADAIHPGYGFLSENAGFAAACCEAGLVFIGPSSAAIEAMGSKARAKHLMMQAGVPCVPGYLGRLENEPSAEHDEDTRLLQEGERLGFPLLVKAVSGGGGRGMRLVHALDELPAALASARREATSAFGDGTLMLERLIERGRHIEIQVFADAHGHAVHLGERDCTAQRRRQKVIEEAPSPVVSEAMRQAMGRDAVAAALAVGYCGAGTVEFIVDADMRHYFLEMNTRLQVEHPVTELVTGLDLVEWQLRVARGEPLPLQQQDIRLTGHAIEARLYAEDPYSRPTAFAPQTGAVLAWPVTEVAGRSGIRVDAGIAMGGPQLGAVGQPLAQVSPHYDAMVAKVMAYGRDRDDAIRRLRAALQDAPLIGLRGNSRFLSDLLGHPRFAQAQMHTALIDEWAEQGESLMQEPQAPAWLWAVAAACLSAGSKASARSLGPAWVGERSLTLSCGQTTETLLTKALEADPESAGPSASTWQVDMPLRLHTEASDAGQTPGRHRVRLWGDRGSHIQTEVDGRQRRLIAHWHAPGSADEILYLVDQGHPFAFERVSAAPKSRGAADPSRALAPVAGMLTQLPVQVGQVVQAGQPLACVEAMKMEMWVHAAAQAQVMAVHGPVGRQVSAGVVLVELQVLAAPESS